MARHPAWITLSVLALAACSDDDPPRKPAQIAVSAGNNQTGEAGAVLPAPIVFVVSDNQGPLAGVRVVFSLPDQVGSLLKAEDTSKADGTVRATWMLGGALGDQHLLAKVAGADFPPAQARAIVSPGPVALVTPTSEATQLVVVGRVVPSSPTVRVTDAYGNPRAGEPVRFFDPTGASTVDGGTATTDANGTAAVRSWKIGARAGSYSLLARAGVQSSATFSAIGVPASTQIAGGNGQTANIGTLVAEAPAVIALDDQNQPLVNVPVSFAVSQGGGQLVNATAVTGPDGVARVDAWILGSAPGANTLVATVLGVPDLTFQATGVAAVPAELVAAANLAPNQFASNYSDLEPAVRVLDAQGRPVAGIRVAFAVTAGGGALTGGETATDFTGRATLGSWRFGAAGLQSVAATVDGISPVAFNVTVGPVPASTYHIDLRYLTAVTDAQRAAFEAAAARWTSIVVGGLAPVTFTPNDDFEGCGPGLNETVQNLLIFVRVVSIDGPSGILGQAGPCFVRNDNLLTIVGIMELDAADLAVLQNQGQLQTVITHEMGHVLGIGSLWPYKGLISGPGSSNPFFTGGSARSAFYGAVNLGAVFHGSAVPIENTGGPGTRDVHWREATVSNELMTGFLNAGPNPLSAFTAASLRDEGYLVNDAAVEPFSFTAALRAASEPPRPLLEGLIPAPIRVVNRRGQVVQTVPRY